MSYEELEFIKYIIEFFEANVAVNAVSPYKEKEIENYLKSIKGKVENDKTRRIQSWR